MVDPIVLVIDDDEQMLRMLNLALSRAGLQVLTALDGPAALDVFREHNPDLALVDIAMPGMDGYDVIRQMREMEQGAEGRMGIIVLTAHSQPVLRTHGADLDVDLYLVKPVTPNDLIDHIHTVLESRED